MSGANVNDEIEHPLTRKERRRSWAGKIRTGKLTNRRFAALSQISSVLEGLAWLGTIFFVLMFFFGITETWNTSIMSVGGAGLFVSVITIAFCELIQLSISIEESAKRGANALVEVLDTLRVQEKEGKAEGVQMENTPSPEV